jgi:hypothetical protein
MVNYLKLFLDPKYKEIVVQLEFFTISEYILNDSRVESFNIPTAATKYLTYQEFSA